MLKFKIQPNKPGPREKIFVFFLFQLKSVKAGLFFKIKNFFLIFYLVVLFSSAHDGFNTLDLNEIFRTYMIKKVNHDK